MTREKKYQLLDLLEELRDEAVKDLADSYDMSTNEIYDMLDNDQEEVYDMDDGDCLLQSIDTIIAVIG